MEQKRVRNVCFTKNNPEGPIPYDDTWMAYLIYQLEIGENKTPHYQGYCEATTQMPFTTWIKKLPGCHLESRRGTQAQAIAYCKKADTRKDGPFEHGTPKAQGQRTDILALADMARTGKRKRDAFEEMPATYMRYYRAYEHVAALYMPEQAGLRYVMCRYGPTGSGKSSWVANEFPDAWTSNVSKDLWFDGYDGQEVACLDEFEGNFPLVLMLRILDLYVIRVPTKGGFTWWNPRLVVVTSNKHPQSWYDFTNRPEHLPALLRRFKHGGIIWTGPDRVYEPDRIISKKPSLATQLRQLLDSHQK